MITPPPTPTPAITQSVASAFLDGPPGFERTNRTVVAIASGTMASTSVLNPMPTPAAKPAASAAIQMDSCRPSRRTMRPHNATVASIQGALAYSIGRPAAHRCDGDQINPAVQASATMRHMPSRNVR